MKTEIILEFNKIKEMLCEYAMSMEAKQKLLQLTPALSENECKRKLQETTEAKAIFTVQGNPPLAAMREIGNLVGLSQNGSMLHADQFTQILRFISSCRQMKEYLKRAEGLDTNLAGYGHTIDRLEELQSEISRCIVNDQVDDGASTALRDVRRKIETTNQQIRGKLETLLQGKRQYFSDNMIVSRNGHLVLPVKKEYKNQINGTVIDTSSTGSTCFMEPTSVRKLQEALNALRFEEDREVEKVLYTLSVMVDGYVPQIKLNMEVMEILDVIFAKARLSASMDGIPVPVTLERRIRILGGRHPLLGKDSCVPLNFTIGDGTTGIVITGPNTGGKTVALKTVGLLSMMAQSGLHVPAEQGSCFTMNNLVLCDIGDGQSITENLSTFSSHILNVIDILNSATKESLVLLDELGSGTDPAEGMGIAVSILEELQRIGCLFVATTHYPEVKDYANQTKGLINARMAFDRESLKPLYRLELGEAGESCALYIAKRLGFPAHMLKTASHYARSAPSENRVSWEEELLEGAAEQAHVKANTSPKIAKDWKDPTPEEAKAFTIGDSVEIQPDKELGIVYQTTNRKGEIGVQIKGVKSLIPYKRVKLLVPASELYPPDYDFSIIFDSVENRKANHKMGKKHNPDLVIRYD